MKPHPRTFPPPCRRPPPPVPPRPCAERGFGGHGRACCHVAVMSLQAISFVETEPARADIGCPIEQYFGARQRLVNSPRAILGTPMPYSGSQDAGEKHRVFNNWCLKQNWQGFFLVRPTHASNPPPSMGLGFLRSAAVGMSEFEGAGWILPHGDRILQQDLESRILIRALVTKDHMGRIVGSQPNRLLPSEDHGVRFPTDMTCAAIRDTGFLRQRKWAHHATISSTSYHIWPALLFQHDPFRWRDTRISGTMALARGLLTMMTTTRGHWRRGCRCPRTRPSRMSYDRSPSNSADTNNARV